MACTYPILAYEVIGETTKRGKSVIVFKRPDDKPHRLIELPCGQCLMCRIEKAKQWQKRIIAESKMHENNYFVTLTYDDESLQTNDCLKIQIDMDTGEILEQKIETKPILVKKDVTDFKKRLLEHFREKGHTGIRFYYCGEYGSTTDRPHYHIIFFNLPLDDLQFYKLNKQGQPMFNSKLLTEKWGMGHVVIGSLTYESAGYVARYVLKKQQSGTIYDGRPKEFTEMSRRPGIGHSYYEKYKDSIYNYDAMLIPKEFENSFWSKPPKYFDDMYSEEENERMYDIKLQRRKKAQNTRDIRAYNKATTLSDYEQRLLEERAVARKMVNLTREL